jgi:hypothetical protein
LRNSAAVLILFSSGLLAQTVRVPFVGCPSAGQTEDVEAPKGADQEVRIEARAARRLAYYKASVAPGVLAPRGWTCTGSYGSAGEGLLVSAQTVAGDASGPGVLVEHLTADAVGRFEIAEVIARVFPSRRAFVQAMIDSGDAPAEGYTFGPYPNDKLLVQTDRLVKFRTAPHSEGLGTTSRLKANDDPIDGAAILQGKNPDLLMLRVRLPPSQRDLAPVIIRDLLIRQRRDAR